MTLLSGIRWLLGGSFVRRAGVLTGGVVASHLILLLSSPLIGRLYGPEQFGVFAAYTPCLALCTLVATLRWDMAVPIPRRAAAGRRIVVLTVLSVIVVTAVLTLASALGYLLWPYVRAWVHSGLLPLLLLGILAEGCGRPMRSWNVRTGHFAPIAKAKVSQSVSLVAGQVFLGLLRAGPAGLLLADVISRAINTLILGLAALGVRPVAVGRDSWRSLRRVAWRYRRFPLFSTWSAVLMLVVDAAPFVLLTAIYSAGAAGLFAMSQRAVLAPLLILSSAFTQVYITDAARAIQRRDGNLQQLFWMMAARSAVVSLLPLAALVLFGPWLFRVAFGSQWVESGQWILFLAPAAFAQFVAGPVYQTLDLLQRQRWGLLANACGAGLVIAMFVAAASQQWDVRSTVIGYSIVITAFNTGLFLVSAVATHRFQQQRRERVETGNLTSVPTPS